MSDDIQKLSPQVPAGLADELHRAANLGASLMRKVLEKSPDDREIGRASCRERVLRLV